MSTISIQDIDDCLPQTQCQQCDYPRCYDYAKAIACGEAKINQCPPGGDATILALANLFEIPPLTLNPEHGVHEEKSLAWIDESACIGCKLCIKACPVDAIIGSTKLMHTVIGNECTGCKLCLPVCPTDCIELVKNTTRNSSKQRWLGYTSSQVNKARLRTQAKLDRETKNQQQKLLKRKKIKQDSLQEKNTFCS